MCRDGRVSAVPPGLVERPTRAVNMQHKPAGALGFHSIHTCTSFSNPTVFALSNGIFQDMQGYHVYYDLKNELYPQYKPVACAKGFYDEYPGAVICKPCAAVRPWRGLRFIL